MINLAEYGNRLAAGANVIVELLQPVGEEQALWRPSPESWSLVEVINHLIDEEKEDFRAHLDLILHSPEIPWPEMDPKRWPIERNYMERDFEESVERFAEERARSCDWLSSLKDPDWDRTHEQPGYPPLRAGDLLVSWAAHDLLHVRQIVRLQYQFLTRLADPYSVRYAGEW